MSWARLFWNIIKVFFFRGIDPLKGAKRWIFHGTWLPRVDSCGVSAGNEARRHLFAEFSASA